MIVRTPWPRELVDRLNEYQKNGRFHPYTCGGDRTNAAHLDGEGVLVATVDGWICPYCTYKQDWAHDFTAGAILEIPPTDVMQKLKPFITEE